MPQPVVLAANAGPKNERQLILVLDPKSYSLESLRRSLNYLKIRLPGLNSASGFSLTSPASGEQQLEQRQTKDGLRVFCFPFSQSEYGP